MLTALVSKQFAAAAGDEMKGVAEREGQSLTFMHAPEEPGARFSQAECDRIDIALMDRDIRFNEQVHAAFSEAVARSKSLKWIQYQSSGVAQQPTAAGILARGAIVTGSTGTNAEPVAQTGFTGLLMLARGFGTYMRGQQKHEWRPLRGAALPSDLRGQTVVLIGVGAIGKIFARYALAFGLKVIGVRRSPLTLDDPIEEMVHPSRLNEVLPRADWIVIACPLSKETRNLLNAESFRHVRKGARLINIARGEIVEEKALLDALKTGKLAGAHLDAHTQEPLPADSPFWDLPNVIISPHNASASAGNEGRIAEMFIANFGHWLRGEKMINLQTKL